MQFECTSVKSKSLSPATQEIDMSSIFRTRFRGSPGCGTYLFAFVFLVRLVALTRLTSSPLLLPSGSDMHFYDDWAKQIVHGDPGHQYAFYGLPLYPYLLAIFYHLFGYSPFVPTLFQVCLEAGTAVLIFKLAVELLRRTSGSEREPAATFVGLSAGAGWAFFVPAQAYSIILMPTAWAVFAFWLLVWQIVRTKTAPSAWQCLGFGILIGIAAMGVAAILFLVPFVIAALCFRPVAVPDARVPSWLSGRLAAAALLFLGIAAGTSPCWIHNRFIARDPVFLSAHGGINLWLGNNPEATGYPHFPGLRAGQAEMLRDSIELAETAAGRSLKRSEVSQYWSRKARDYISSNPGAWLKLMCRKIGNFWNAFEYDDLGVITNLREAGIVFPGLRFGLVAALGLSGALFSWRAFPASRWIVAAVLLHLLAILPVFVTERYRLTVVPGLLVLAALGLARLWHRCSTRNYGRAALQLGVIGASAWFVTMPRHDPSLWALKAYNSGRFALETDNLPAAEHHLLRARALVPNNAETHFALGNLRLAQHDSAAAKDSYESALKLDPRHKGALNNLGVLALNENQAALAEDYFRRSLAAEPRHAKTHYLLAKALAARGNQSEARIEAARAVELDANQPEFKALSDQLAGNGN
jgi:4-amino-4-deoxy-L-arabinose transferase-like glycosyltransferase